LFAIIVPHCRWSRTKQAGSEDKSINAYDLQKTNSTKPPEKCRFKAEITVFYKNFVSYFYFASPQQFNNRPYNKQQTQFHGMPSESVSDCKLWA